MRKRERERERVSGVGGRKTRAFSALYPPNADGINPSYPPPPKNDLSQHPERGNEGSGRAGEEGARMEVGGGEREGRDGRTGCL